MPKARKRKPPAFLQWASAVAAVGSLLAAIASCENSRLANATLHLEEQASLNLSCATRFNKPGDPYPSDPYLFGLTYVFHQPDLYGPFPAYDQSGHLEEVPLLYTDCSLTNYGRLPAQNIDLGLNLSFLAMATGARTITQQTIRVNGLVSGESHHFQIINDTSLQMLIAFERTVIFTDVEGVRHHVPLIVDDSVLSVEQSATTGRTKPLVIPTATPTPYPRSSGQRP
jgi:hypothetical protein